MCLDRVLANSFCTREGGDQFMTIHRRHRDFLLTYSIFTNVLYKAYIRMFVVLTMFDHTYIVKDVYRKQRTKLVHVFAGSLQIKSCVLECSQCQQEISGIKRNIQFHFFSRSFCKSFVILEFFGEENDTHRLYNLPIQFRQGLWKTF